MYFDKFFYKMFTFFFLLHFSLLRIKKLYFSLCSFSFSHNTTAPAPSAASHFGTAPALPFSLARLQPCPFLSHSSRWWWLWWVCGGYGFEWTTFAVANLAVGWCGSWSFRCWGRIDTQNWWILCDGFRVKLMGLLWERNLWVCGDGFAVKEIYGFGRKFWVCREFGFGRNGFAVMLW